MASVFNDNPLLLQTWPWYSLTTLCDFRHGHCIQWQPFLTANMATVFSDNPFWLQTFATVSCSNPLWLQTWLLYSATTFLTANMATVPFVTAGMATVFSDNTLLLETWPLYLWTSFCDCKHYHCIHWQLCDCKHGHCIQWQPFVNANMATVSCRNTFWPKTWPLYSDNPLRLKTWPPYPVETLCDWKHDQATVFSDNPL